MCLYKIPVVNVVTFLLYWAYNIDLLQIVCIVNHLYCGYFFKMLPVNNYGIKIIILCLVIIQTTVR